MRRILVMVALAILSFASFALPSIDEVQAEVQRGNYVQAESLMREVVRARPGSAKAHYVYAEILAHNRHFDQAAQEAREARRVAPDLNFTQPDKFRAFEQLLAREQRTGRSLSSMSSPSTAWMQALGERPPANRNSSLPGWIGWLAAAAVALLLWLTVRAVRQSAAMPAGYAGAGYGAPAQGPNPASGSGPVPGYGQMNSPPSAGSGMLGTGLAAAGGFAAGMLADKLFEGGRERGMSGSGAASSGGLAPGAFDEASARNEAAGELEQRQIDFGSGGDWDSGSDANADNGNSSDDGW